MPSETGAVTVPQPIPNPNLLQPQTGQRQSSPTYFLRSTPPIFTVLNVGGSNTNQDFAFKATQIPLTRPQFTRFFIARAAGKVETPGLIHARALGGPQVNSRFSVASLVHARGQGALVISTSTPPDPPDPPDPDPTSPSMTLTGGPRTITSIRRRNVTGR